MCVIAIANDIRMTEDHVKKMFSSNRDGGGIAYREHGKVQWKKGLDEEEMHDLCLTVPLPYVAHFRIASCGGVLPELTHPFPIQKEVPLTLKGSTNSHVLFHNGHMPKWKEEMRLMILGQGIKLPPGPFTDTRFMAWAAAHSNLNLLAYFDEKLVAFGLHDMDIWGTGWTKVDGLFVSNRSWEHGGHHNHHYSTITVCRFGQCKKDRINNSVWCELHQGGIERPPTIRVEGAPEVSPVPETFRGGVRIAESETALKKAVEEVSQPLRARGQEVEGPTASTLNEGRKMINWVRRLNPKTYSKSGTIDLPSDEDTIAHQYPIH